MDKEIFVQNINFFCKNKGVPPTVACRESEVGTSFITDVKRGQTPSVAKVQLLAQYLGVTTSELLGEPVPCAPAVVSELDTLAPDKAQLLAAYDRADEKSRALVRLALGLD